MPRSLLLFIAAALAIAAAAWQFGSPTPTLPPTASMTPIAPACPLPSQLAGEDGAVQSDVPGELQPFPLPNAAAKPLAGFSVAARVLLREDYDDDREADFSPVDLALGWGRMRDDAVLSELDLSQSGRFYHYRWSGEPPLPPTEIAQSSANMHMVPANAAIASALGSVQAGERVRIDGWLVRIDSPDGWHWKSSLTRNDVGAGACELVYVCAISRM